jgi:hypothetical protein
MIALLPKLHMKRHTSQFIIFGPKGSGGLALPHIYKVQGIDKLKLFVGHLRLHDRTGQLIQIDLSYVQLLTGTSKFFLNCDYSNFLWVEPGWFTSLWDFANQSN